MKRFLALASLVAVAAVFASAAGAAAPARDHDRDVIRFFVHHPRLASSPAGERELWRVLGHVSDRLRSLQSAAPAHLALWRCIAGYPGARPGGTAGESGGNPAASNGSHFNVLQMTRPWGDGDYYIADPAAVPASVVIAAAERGYAANHYSTGWLAGQWGETLGPCWRFV